MSEKEKDEKELELEKEILEKALEKQRLDDKDLEQVAGGVGSGRGGDVRKNINSNRIPKAFILGEVDGSED